MRLPKKTKPYHLKDVKFGLVISVIAISIIGVMVIGSAKQAVQRRQIIGLVAGVILMIILSMIDYVWLLNFYWIVRQGLSRDSRMRLPELTEHLL